MKALIQRVKKASVTVNEKIVGKIDKGILIFFGTTHMDDEKKLPALVNKIINLRIFSDENEKLNFSLLDVKGEVLVVSQFTLYADVSKGRRPSFINSQKPDRAKALYEKFIYLLSNELEKVNTGIFGAKMQVSLINDGPLTFIVEI